MKILLFGKNGQVGWELQRSLLPLGDLIALDRHSPELCGDLTNLKGIAETIKKVAPNIIINAAAYTNVDKAEEERDLASTINTEAPSILANEAKKLDALFVHYSTDYVFGGNGDNPKKECDSTSPLNVYGKTKRDGEELIFTSNCHHLIFRTSWVYGAYGNNFIRTMLRLGKERDSLKVVDDQIGAPTGAELLADITAHTVRTALQQPDADVSGLYHLAANGYTSWHAYARLIFEQAQKLGSELKIQPDQLISIPSNEFPTLAKRPLNSRLNTQKLQTTFNINLPSWETPVRRTVAEILSNNSQLNNSI